MLRSILEVDLESQYILADALPILVMMADADGQVTFFNRAWYEYTGHAALSQGDVGDWGRFIHPDDLDRVASEWREAIASGSETFATEHRLREAATGRYRWFKTKAVALRSDSGQIVRWIGTAIDIDDDRRVALHSNYIAERLQELYAPAELPKTDVARFSAWYQSAQDDLLVGGDWYKVVAIDHERILFAVGDVAGHGLEAAVAMGRARQSVFTAAVNARRPATILKRANNVLARQATIVTAVVGILHVSDGRIEYASAGHPPAVFVQADGAARFLAHGDPPLGIDSQRTFAQHTLHTQKGSLLVLYTDGLIEFDRNAVDGEQRLLRAAVSLRSDSGPKLAQRLAELVIGTAKHPDDIAVLTISFD